MLERTYKHTDTTLSMEPIGPTNAAPLLLTVRELTATRFVVVKEWNDTDGHHAVINEHTR